MGTRNLTIVFMNGEYHLAQYGQWDGYPEGQGMTCLEFLRNEMDEQEFRCALSSMRFIDWNTNVGARILEAFNNGVPFPEFDRDTGAEILWMIQNCQTTSRYLRNDIEFAAASLFCEWAWVIDLDKRTFEAYEGYNKTPLTPEDRFHFLVDKEETYHDSGIDEEYHAVRMVASWSLDDLPTDEQFLAAFKSDDDDDG